MFMLPVGYAPTKLVQLSNVDTIQDFVCELSMKPHAHLVKIKKNHIIMSSSRSVSSVVEI